ncbi:hypothetical protein [Streptomyces sp. 3211]|uniref:hypothetical protein n=1 Tax=Streptomyces sp. 3211 TaxID=1964449 RepID=UPI0009A53FA1|nr:hypothetical protein [Streptomyces sp. 3211]
MTRTPDAVTTASLDTHRLIVTMPNDGPPDVRSNLPRGTVAALLRHLADELTDEQPLAALPGEAYAMLTTQLSRPHRPIEAAHIASTTLAHHTRELANLLDSALAPERPAAPSVGRHLVSMLRSHAVRLDAPPRTAVDDVLDLAAARLARRAQR